MRHNSHDHANVRPNRGNNTRTRAETAPKRHYTPGRKVTGHKMKAPTPCLEQGCPGKAKFQGRCEQHRKPLVFNSYRKLTLPKDWNTRRAIVLRRDKSVCYVCQGTATQVDHIEPGENHELNNLRAICHACHIKKTSQEGNKARAGNRIKPRR